MITKRTLDAKVTEAENGALVTVTGSVDFYKEVLSQEDISAYGGANRYNRVTVDKKYVFGGVTDAGEALEEILKECHKELDTLEAQVLKAAGSPNSAEPVKRGRGRPRKNAN